MRYDKSSLLELLFLLIVGGVILFFLLLFYVLLDGFFTWAKECWMNASKCGDVLIWLGIF